ncbi:methyl-accepting chemotaxis protein [Robbsia sp. Bb-Pol-6]|uniref:Methyl-accepting chemotaxis protein n=1 Tax=Robbsia betulipollinis TaxID=2981849 RepID=A0ABT3ZKF6_9BURK|nr:methyl-accepting chemotaxis protein [Robbsia betulipollinis]MCY0387013.1 methyl-accepting chemotaxis protein [Robbsia betulipollinis]
MQNLTIRSSLLMVLAAFAAMIVFGACIGVVALGRANDGATRLYDIARQELLVNDGYKETTRVRSALTRAYAALKERNDTSGRDSALDSARKSFARGVATGQAFHDAAAFPGRDEAIRQAIVDAGAKMHDALLHAIQALDKGDTAAYVRINDAEVIRGGMQYGESVEAFQKSGEALMRDDIAASQREHAWVLGLVIVGVLAALALTLTTHLALRRLLIRPLEGAVRTLDEIASGDLTSVVPPAGRNEIGQLLQAMTHMQHELTATVMNVRTNSQAIDTGAREIAAGNADLASRTEEQSAALEQTSASMQELTSTVKANADNAREASALALAASDIAHRGGDVVGRAIATMDAIQSSSSKIADITGLIDSIAFQTNILALNAAVEAARAGEHGRGFAVVASEVRGLAQRSASAAKDIKTLIDTSVRDVHQGNGLVAQAGGTMTEIVGAIGKVATLMNDITAATVEQSTGIDQVGLAVRQMDQVTQQNAALVEQASAAASSLEQQAGRMVAAVSAFTVR